MTKKQHYNISDEEDAAINAGIAADPDTYELTDKDMAKMVKVEVDKHGDVMTALREACAKADKKVLPK